MPNPAREDQLKQAQKDAMFLLKALQQTRTPVVINLASIVQPGQKVDTVKKQFSRIKIRNDINITTTAVGFTETSIVRTPQSQPATTPDSEGLGTSSSSSMKAISEYPAVNVDEDKDHKIGVASTPVTPRQSKRARKPSSKKRACSEAVSDEEMTFDHSESDFADDTSLHGAGPGPQMSPPKRRKGTFGGKSVARKGSFDADENSH